jgi:hypothetical protein
MCSARDTVIVAGASYTSRAFASFAHSARASAGGWNGVSSLADVHVFDVRSCTWSETETKGVTWNGWAGSAFALASDGVSVLVFGGHSASQV